MNALHWKPHVASHPIARQRGFSLVELMIAMAIGMVVMGAVFATYIAANQGTRHSQAISQMAEDASSALAVLRANTAMAGFSEPTSVSEGSLFTLTMPGRYAFGCEQHVFDNTVGPIDDLGCKGDLGGNDSLAVAYQANRLNSATNSSFVPLDCLGNAIQLDNGHYISYSRFYLKARDANDLSRGFSLMCQPAEGSAQPLAENIKDMQIQYGIQAAPVDGERKAVSFYTDAQTVTDNTWWDRVASIRICLVMQSADPNVLDAALKGTTYPGCFGTPVEPEDGDRHAYRAFTTTIALNNRLPMIVAEPSSGGGKR